MLVPIFADDDAQVFIHECSVFARSFQNIINEAFSEIGCVFVFVDDLECLVETGGCAVSDLLVFIL